MITCPVVGTQLRDERSQSSFPRSTTPFVTIKLDWDSMEKIITGFSAPDHPRFFYIFRLQGINPVPLSIINFLSRYVKNSGYFFRSGREHTLRPMLQYANLAWIFPL